MCRGVIRYWRPVRLDGASCCSLFGSMLHGTAAESSSPFGIWSGMRSLEFVDVSIFSVFEVLIGRRALDMS